MFTSRPFLQYLSCYHLHIFVEGRALGFERSFNGLGDAEPKVFKGDGHLSSGWGRIVRVKVRP